jgi:DNA-directed RNA polymerase
MNQQVAWERQRDLEDNALGEGARRFKERLAAAEATGTLTTVGAAKRLLLEAIEPLEAAIKNMLELSTKTRGAKHCAVKWCELVGPDVAAYMTVKILLDGLAQNTALRLAALKISDLILDELRYRRFQAQAPELFDYKLKSFNTSNYRHMSRSMDAAMRFAEVEVADLNMSNSQRMLVGTKLIDLFIQTTGMVETVTVTRRSRSRKERVKTDLLIRPTAETLEWMQKRNDHLEMLYPISLPMIVPPLPWDRRVRGGYRFALRGKHPLVRGISGPHAKSMVETNAPIIYDSLNRIQNTPWKINQRVLELVLSIQDAKISLAGIPCVEEESLPNRPVDIETNVEARRTWRKAAHVVKERNHERAVAVLSIGHTLDVAKRLRSEAAIYFPHNLDFRGRIYPITNYLSPQGDDLSKGLLLFSQGKPLGDSGAIWLAMHGANCLGTTREGMKLSKMTLQERVDYILQLTLDIEEAAADPLGNRWWAEADEPIQFFAFCVEWAEWAKLHRDGRGNEYVCSLPCSQDGSCNGLQHFGAMFRDEVGGRAVNLLPSDRPEDLYHRVAESVLDKLETLVAAAGKEPAVGEKTIERKRRGTKNEKVKLKTLTVSDAYMATLWLDSGLVNRKLTKRPTMTFGYGSKKFGFKQQLIDEVKSRENSRELQAHFSVEHKGKRHSLLQMACSLMSKLIWESLQDVVVAAFYGMQWMQKSARAIASGTGKPVEWTVPITGFRVKQEYFVINRKQIKTMLAGRIIQPSVYEPTDVVDSNKQASAISPNFVHSLDAAALMLTVQMAGDEGLTHFACVHDSYGTLPSDCPVLARCTRQAFYRLHSEDIVASLHNQLLAQKAEDTEIDAPPARGSLDLGGVLASEYFFS